MALTSNWLIATYGTKYAMKTLDYAAVLSTELKDTPSVTILIVAKDMSSEAESADILHKALIRFAEKCEDKILPDIEVRIGEPTEEILTAIKELQIDHLFMGGGDFKYDINMPGGGGISNRILNEFHGTVTLVK